MILQPFFCTDRFDMDFCHFQHKQTIDGYLISTQLITKRKTHQNVFHAQKKENSTKTSNVNKHKTYDK